jgi:outer membrane immunogenic protein
MPKIYSAIAPVTNALTGDNMKKRFLLGILSLAAMAAPALAADLPVRAPPPYVPPMFNWSGFYIGANGGWGQSDNCLDLLTPAGALFVDGCHDRSGGVIGGQIGYRWQTPGSHWVFGLEAQGDWANFNGTHVSVVDPGLTFGTKTDGLGLFTGQWGFAWDTWLWYVKGGAAVTSNSAFVNSTLTGIGLASASSTRWGGAIGTGLEYAFSPSWSVGFEYDHLFMGGTDSTFSGAVDPRVAGTIARVNQGVDMVTIRFNWRFGGYGGLY